jgi:hypothetical protein
MFHFVIIRRPSEETFSFLPNTRANIVQFSAVLLKSRTLMLVTWLVACPRFSVDLVWRGFVQIEPEFADKLHCTASSLQCCPYMPL